MPNNSDLQFVEVEFMTPLYDLTVALRDKLLRKPLGLAFAVQDLEKEYADHHLALIDKGNVVACLVLSPKGEGQVKMRQVAVDNELQSRGLGSLLVKESEQFCIDRKYTSIVLNARATALTFYKKLNYQVDGDLFTEVGIDHYKMFKKL